ncbi:MAG: beta-galactosidase, partial [Bacteroidales bacterium]
DAPVKVLLTSERPSVKNCWDDIVYVKATVVDKNGLRNPNADHKLTFKISGPGVLVAVDNGSPTSHEPYKTNVRSVDRGEAVALIQANANSGKITLTVSAEGLEGSAVTIEAEPGK